MSEQIKTIKDEHGEFLAGDYYDMSAGNYSGVYMPEHVMRKMARLAVDYQTEARRLLQQHADELFVSNWTVASQMKDGKIAKQITLRFVTRESMSNGDVQRRIDLFRAPQPTHFDRVYVVDSYFDAKPVAESVLAAVLEAEKQS